MEVGRGKIDLGEECKKKEVVLSKLRWERRDENLRKGRELGSAMNKEQQFSLQEGSMKVIRSEGIPVVSIDKTKEITKEEETKEEKSMEEETNEVIKEEENTTTELQRFISIIDNSLMREYIPTLCENCKYLVEMEIINDELLRKSGGTMECNKLIEEISKKTSPTKEEIFGIIEPFLDLICNLNETLNAELETDYKGEGGQDYKKKLYTSKNPYKKYLFGNKVKAIPKISSDDAKEINESFKKGENCDYEELFNICKRKLEDKKTEKKGVTVGEVTVYIQNLIRWPGGEHEWLKTSQIITLLNDYNVDDLELIWQSRSNTLRLGFIGTEEKIGDLHGGKNSTTWHNKLDEILKHSSSLGEYIYELNKWVRGIDGYGPKIEGKMFRLKKKKGIDKPYRGKIEETEIKESIEDKRAPLPKTLWINNDVFMIIEKSIKENNKEKIYQKIEKMFKEKVSKKVYWKQDKGKGELEKIKENERTKYKELVYKNIEIDCLK